MSLEGWGWALIGVNVALSLLNLSIAAPYRGEPKAKGIRVAEWLVAQKVDRVLPKQSLHGKRPEYVFADAGVGMTLVEADSLNQALEALDR